MLRISRPPDSAFSRQWQLRVLLYARTEEVPVTFSWEWRFSSQATYQTAFSTECMQRQSRHNYVAVFGPTPGLTAEVSDSSGFRTEWPLKIRINIILNKHLAFCQVSNHISYVP